MSTLTAWQNNGQYPVKDTKVVSFKIAIINMLKDIMENMKIMTRES